MFLFVFALFALVVFPDESSANKSRGVIRDGNATGSSYSPTDVDPKIKRAWERWNRNDQKMFIKGGKNFKYPTSSGRYLAFDIYEEKEWRIRNNQLIFEGWSANIGRYHHDRYNQATYIGAIELDEKGTKETGKRKIFKTEMLIGDHAATKSRGKNSDLYYDNGPNTKWCPESTSSVNHGQNECNMEYKHVGFRAHLPLKELFPSTKENKQWELYLIKNH